MLYFNDGMAHPDYNNQSALINTDVPQEEILNERMDAFTNITEWTAMRVNAIQNVNAPMLRPGLSAMVRTSGKSQQALGNPTEERKMMALQIQAGRTFVRIADKYLEENIDLDLASIRDIVASYCTENAQLLNDDTEIDYWSTIQPQLDNEYRTTQYVMQ